MKNLPLLALSSVIICSVSVASAGDSVIRTKVAKAAECTTLQNSGECSTLLNAAELNDFRLKTCHEESDAICGGGRHSCNVIKDQAFVIKDRAFVIKDQLAYSSEMGGMKHYGIPANSLAKSLVDGDAPDSAAAKSFPAVAPVVDPEARPALGGSRTTRFAVEKFGLQREGAAGGGYWVPGVNGAEGGTYTDELPIDRFARSFPATGRALLGIGRQMTDASGAAGGGRVLAISEGDSAILLENGIKAGFVAALVAGLDVFMKAVCPASIMMMSAPTDERPQASIDSDESEEWGVRCEFVGDRQFACEGPELGDLSLTVDWDPRNPAVTLN